MSASQRASSFSSLKNGLPHAGGGASGDRGSSENLNSVAAPGDVALTMTQIVYLLVDIHKLNEMVQLRLRNTCFK